MPRNRVRPVASTVEVNSLSEYMSAIHYCYEELDAIDLWYRGHESSTWQLQPSIYRNLEPFMHKNIREWSKERTMFVTFQSAAYSRAKNLPDQNDISKWLCLMRHYGLSTRLLDWSRSPLVAAYFALKKSHTKHRLFGF